MTDERKRRSPGTWRTSNDGTATIATINSRRQQEQRLAAEIVYSPAWSRIRAIADGIKSQYAAPLPTKYGSENAYQVFNIVRDALDAFLAAAETDAGLAPVVTGDEE